MMCCCRFRERTRYISLVLTTQTGKRSLTCSNIKTEFSLSVAVGDVWRDIIWLSGEAWSLWDFDVLSLLDKVSNEASLFCLQTERRTSLWIFLHSQAIRKIHLAAVCTHVISKRKEMRPDETIKQQNRGTRCAFSYLPILRFREQTRSE